MVELRQAWKDVLVELIAGGPKEGFEKGLDVTDSESGANEGAK